MYDVSSRMTQKIFIHNSGWSAILANVNATRHLKKDIEITLKWW